MNQMGGTVDSWGDELKRARLTAGYQYRKDLAGASGVSKATIDELEQGKRLPRQDTLAALREALPTLRHPLELTRDEQGGIVVHLPMDPDERARMLSDLLREALDQSHRRIN